METIVWWNAGGGSSNEEVQWRPMSGGTQGRESFDVEADWRPLFGGTQGREV